MRYLRRTSIAGGEGRSSGGGARRQDRSYSSMCWPIRNTPFGRPKIGGFRTSRRPAAARGHPDRRDHLAAPRCGRSPTSRSICNDLRRPSGDRDRKRAAVRRGAGAHARTLRSAGAADGDVGGATASSQLAWRARAGVPGHAGERDPHLRGEVRQLYRTRETRFRIVAMHGAPPACDELRRREPIVPASILSAASWRPKQADT